MAAKKFTFQKLFGENPDPYHVIPVVEDEPYFGHNDFGYEPGPYGNDPTPFNLPSLTESKNDVNPGFVMHGTTKGQPSNSPNATQRTTGQAGFDYSMFGKWGGGSSRSGGTADQSMFGGRINQPTQYKPPTGSVTTTSTRVIKPEGSMPTLAPGTPFAAPEKTDVEPVRRKEMGSSYRRLSQVVARALAGIGDEDVMGTQKREVLEGFGNTLSDAQQGAYRVARSEGDREDVRKMTGAQANWQAGEKTRMANFNASLQDYFKQYTTSTTSTKKMTYGAEGPDEKEKFGFGMTPSASLDLGNVVERYFG